MDFLSSPTIGAQRRRDEEDEAAGRPRWGAAAAEDADESEEDEEADADADDNEEELRLEEEIRLDEAADAEDFFDVSRRVFPVFSGQGLFSLVCLCNHACVPSVVTRFRSWKGATLVRVEALRDIPAGEELTLSYVDEGESLEDRTRALAPYGFKCQCSKCLEEGRRRGESEGKAPLQPPPPPSPPSSADEVD